MPEIVLPIHLTVLGVTVLGILIADHEAFLWIRGKKPVLEFKKIFRLHIWVGIGLIGMIITGFLMFWPAHTYLLTKSPAFLGKMFFVALLVGNSFFLGEMLKISTKRTFASLTPKEKRPMYISGALSTISWVSAATLAFFIYPF